MTQDELNNWRLQEELDRAMWTLSDKDLAPLMRYVNDKIPPGSFLRAVLENNLKDAMGRADMTNRRRVFEYVEWLYNKAPGVCWGSPENVEAWLARRQPQNSSEGI